MLIIRGTKKLRDRLNGPLADAGDESTTALGDWFATVLFWRPQAVMLVNARTLVPVFMPLAPAASLVERIPTAIASVLRRDGIDGGTISSELAAMDELRIAPTNNRSVLGVMNEFAFLGKAYWDRGLTDLDQLSLNMSQVPVGPLRSRSRAPDLELAAVLGRSQETASPRRGRRRTARLGSVYQLKVELLEVKPPVWRRLLVAGSSTLDQVHDAIQAAFGWWDYHLHEFEIAGREYGVPDPDEDWGTPTLDERPVRLDSVVSAGQSFRYTYDFGDDWRHKVTVEDILPNVEGAVPACIDGRRACPPEDSGGPWGYARLLEILADPAHPEHHQHLEWVGGHFDPEAFDSADFEHNLQAARLARLDD